MTLLICRTCPRYDHRASGRFARSFRAALIDALASHTAPVATRGVLCLGACPKDGVVALDDPGKARVRLTGLDSAAAPAVIAASDAYDTSDTGIPGDWKLPDALAKHLSSITRKRNNETAPPT